MTLGEQIKQQREEAGMTQEELAERLGVSRQAVSKWESGLSIPRGANRAAPPASVQLFFTPSGSETMEQTELLLTRSIPDGENCVLLPAQVLRRDSQGHLSVSLSLGGQAVVSDLYNIFYDPALLP